tara:strand:- start:1225 stop:1818 length:594 start_codon:yes stop_codon:yes gene_type:complete
MIEIYFITIIIFTFVISLGIIKKEDTRPHYYHLDSRGRIKGFDDDEKSKNKDTYVLIRPTLSDTYGNGLIDGILEWGTLNEVRSDLNQLIRHRRVIRRALGNFGGWRIKKTDLDSKVNTMRIDHLNYSERERALNLINKIQQDHKKIMNELSNLPGKDIENYKNKITNIVVVGIIDGLNDTDITKKTLDVSTTILAK